MRNNQSGQMTIEMVMIAAMTMMIVTFVSKKFEEEQILQGLSLNPWNSFIVGMIENGVWGSADQTAVSHPHAFSRHSSREGERVQ
ncbi:MAG: hypothetical protein A4S09_10570 [Proteobacteria bacterium SG_bin7]|nr:MAG: hypothetical protein A4S09_10570 [Proteobacteria bacterium SG_bin7]